MSAEGKPENIGLLIPPIFKPMDIFLSSFVKILSAITEDVYVIAANADPRNCGKAQVSSTGYKPGANIFTKIGKHIYLQLKLSCQLAGLVRKVDLWFFFLAQSLLLPMLTAKLLGGKKVVLVLGGSVEKEDEAQKDVLYQPLILFEKFNCALADRIILYSPRLIEEWELQRYRNKILIASRHFLDFDKFTIQKRISERENLCGYIGVLRQSKGILNFLEAVQEISKRGKKVRFLIGGDGPARRDLKEYCHKANLQDRVRMVGWIPHDEVPKYLNELKLLVLPSYTEGLPNIMLESMACGTPVLATPVGGIPDIIKDGETGFIAESNSPECLANNIERVLSYPDLDEIITNARKLVEREFSFTAAVDRYKRILADV